MTITYPESKQADLLQLLQVGWGGSSSHTLHTIAQVLGHLRTVAGITPLGSFFSIRIQQWLNACQASLSCPTLAEAWRSKKGFRPPAGVTQDLLTVHKFLTCKASAQVWSRPIGLLVPRTPHVNTLTDASYEGLGGFSIELRFQWRLSSDDLLAAGFPVLTEEPPRYGPFPQGKLHINILEFYAIMINTWLTIKLAMRRPTPPGGFVFHCLADNTSALSWMAKASRSRRPIVQRAARAYAALLTFAAAFPFRIQSSHIPGIDNVAADALSRYHQFPTWSSCSKAAPELRGLTRYLLPPELLSFLLSTASAKPTEETSETQISALLSLEPTTLLRGARGGDSATSASPRPHQGMRGTSSRRTRKTSPKATV